VFDVLASFFFFLSMLQFRNKKIWGVVQSLELLQPYANPRSSYPGNNYVPLLFIYYYSFHIYTVEEVCRNALF
jgi:hypothetical protein